jgi:hypothetical protein
LYRPRDGARFTLKEVEKMSVDVSELEARQREQEEVRKRADLVADWLDGKLPPSEPQTDPSPALTAQQAAVERYNSRYGGGDRAADAAAHAARLEERNKQVAEAHARRQAGWRPGAKSKVVSTGGGFTRHEIQYE